MVSDFLYFWILGNTLLNKGKHINSVIVLKDSLWLYLGNLGNLGNNRCVAFSRRSRPRHQPPAPWWCPLSDCGHLCSSGGWAESRTSLHSERKMWSNSLDQWLALKEYRSALYMYSILFPRFSNFFTIRFIYISNNIL